jgi:DNA-binding MarR family transcriptional regulator
VPTDEASRQRLNAVLASLAQFVNNRSLDLVHASRSGVPLSLATAAVLGRIVDASPVGLTELRQQTRLQSAALSHHIRTLAEMGYIERRGDPKDGRAAVVVETDEGRAACARFRAVKEELLSAQLIDWSTEELNALSAKMERLDADLRSRDKRAPITASETDQSSGQISALSERVSISRNRRA